MNFNLSGEGSVRISAASSIRTSSQPNGIGCSSTKGYLQRSTEIDGLSLFISKKKKIRTEIYAFCCYRSAMAPYL